VDPLFGYTLKNIEDADMVGNVIQNEDNEESTKKDKPMGFSFWRKDEISLEVIWNLFQKVVKSNKKFNTLDPLIVTVHSVKMLVGFGSLDL
jgi:hypothetical protein